MSKKLTIDQFIDQYAGLELSEESLAQTVISKLDPRSDLYKKALAFKICRNEFLNSLEDVGL
jgi:hypothetical protein